MLKVLPAIGFYNERSTKHNTVVLLFLNYKLLQTRRNALRAIRVCGKDKRMPIGFKNASPFFAHQKASEFRS